MQHFSRHAERYSLITIEMPGMTEMHPAYYRYGLNHKFKPLVLSDRRAWRAKPSAFRFHLFTGMFVC
jgi:hypothetical protein